MLDATVVPQIELQNNGTTAAAVELHLEVFDPSGKSVGTSMVCGSETFTYSLTGNCIERQKQRKRREGEKDTDRETDNKQLHTWVKVPTLRGT